MASLRGAVLVCSSLFAGELFLLMVVVWLLTGKV